MPGHLDSIAIKPDSSGQACVLSPDDLMVIIRFFSILLEWDEDRRRIDPSRFVVEGAKRVGSV